ncbi:guanitoxin biosynthesis MATE family efflux transporter GntT [Chroococcus sp. FPU101]|uniref:guanitoxin biosynthesis MATE family efflux transporter GntT n=1 Tax=Chroococcus sp. FPU101 TaxID=1974212 RepID=UPI001AA31E70|nr:guanitoxin biosynthesis MATE family efflux transporter GntT [Chroococcus sp. FPU101]GFE70715.1 MATE efflux family protein [Chroococcus sp. FPU101]
MSSTTLPTLVKEDVRENFYRLAFINILSNLMVPLSGFLSVAFLGHLQEIHYLAGVTLATILFNYLYRTLSFLRMSTTAITAQAVGGNNEDLISLTLMRNALLAFSLGILLLVFHQPLGNLGFALLSAVPEVKEAGQAYYNTQIWGAPATLLNFVLIGWFLGRGHSGKVFWMSLVGNGANIVLDYLFIMRFQTTSAGAGLATSISQYFMLLVGLFFICREIKLEKIKSLLGQIWVSASWKETLILNRDIFIRTLAFLSTFSLFTNLSSAMGTMTLAENALLLQVITLTVYIVDGLAYATESMAGMFKGKGEYEQLYPLLQMSGQASLTIGLSFAVACLLFPDSLLGLLTNHADVLECLHPYIPWLLPVLGFGSLAFMLDGYFLGLAEGAILRNTALVATLAGFVPLAIIAWQFQSVYLLWLALSLFMVVRVTLLSLQVPKTLKS